VLEDENADPADRAHAKKSIAELERMEQQIAQEIAESEGVDELPPAVIH